MFHYFYLLKNQTFVSENETVEIRTIINYEFLIGTTVLETKRNTNITFGSDATTQQIVSNLFSKFCTWKFDLTNDARDRHELKVNNEEQKITLGFDPSLSELTLKFAISKTNNNYLFR